MYTYNNNNIILKNDMLHTDHLECIFKNTFYLNIINLKKKDFVEFHKLFKLNYIEKKTLNFHKINKYV